MRTAVSFLILMTFDLSADAQTLASRVDRELPRLIATYKQLHAAPELSYREEKTAAFVAAELRKLGYAVTERFGKYEQPGLTSYGVVGVLRNGAGPTVMIRTDLDALPLEEKTGLPYASSVRVNNEEGIEVPVMHACGHDVHMTSFLGTAKMLADLKDRWKGTVVMIGQPAEEKGSGAKAMLAAGLYEKFPRPDYVLALHDNATLDTGKVGLVEGYALASVDSVDITVRGVGGHGAYPHTTKDPIVIASGIVLALQTIVSRERPPLDPAVITVGSFQGGTKHNIIPDEVKLQLTVRAYKKEVRDMLLASIARIARGIAIAGGVPDDRLPVVTLIEQESIGPTYNDPALTQRMRKSLTAALGQENVVTVEPVMGGEDFGQFTLEGQKIPISLFWLGAVEPARAEAGRRGEISLPSLHSPLFAPVPEPTIRTGVVAMTSAALDLLQ